MMIVAVFLLVTVTLGSAYPVSTEPGQTQPGLAYPTPYHHAPYWGGFPLWGFPAPVWGAPAWGSGANMWRQGGYYGAHSAAGLMFYGLLPGTCEGRTDGLYYLDDHSFAYCFSGKKTIQDCAKGSANPPIGHFTSGKHYGFHEFCSINLVNHGYGSRYHGDDKQGHQYGGYHEATSSVSYSDQEKY